MTNDPLVKPLIAAFPREIRWLQRSIVDALAGMVSALQGEALGWVLEFLSVARQNADLLVRQKAATAIEGLKLPSEAVANPRLPAMPKAPATSPVAEPGLVEPWQDLLADWRLQLPDAHRIERAKQIVHSGGVARADLALGTYKVEQQIVHLEPGHTACDCQDYKHRQKRTGTACKHLVALAMYLRPGRE